MNSYEYIDYYKSMQMFEITESFTLPKKFTSELEKFSFGNINNQYKKYFNFLCEKLKSYSIDPEFILKLSRNTAKNTIKSINNSYAKNKDIGKNSKLLINDISKSIKKIKKYIQSIVNDKFDISKIGFNTIIQAVTMITLLATVIFMNDLCFEIIYKIFNNNYEIALFLLPVLIAPIIEESAKYLALKLNYSYGIAYTAFFALTEMATYISYYVGLVGFNAIFITRLYAVILHMTTMLVQKKFMKMDKSKLGFVVAILIHSAYNFYHVS